MQKNPIIQAWDTATTEERTVFIYELDLRYKGRKHGTGLMRIFDKYMSLIEKVKNDRINSTRDG